MRADLIDERTVTQQHQRGEPLSPTLTGSCRVARTLIRAGGKDRSLRDRPCLDRDLLATHMRPTRESAVWLADSGRVR